MARGWIQRHLTLNWTVALLQVPSILHGYLHPPRAQAANINYNYF